MLTVRDHRFVAVAGLPRKIKHDRWVLDMVERTISEAKSNGHWRSAQQRGVDGEHLHRRLAKKLEIMKRKEGVNRMETSVTSNYMLFGQKIMGIGAEIHPDTSVHVILLDINEYAEERSNTCTQN